MGSNIDNQVVSANRNLFFVVQGDFIFGKNTGGSHLTEEVYILTTDLNNK